MRWRDQNSFGILILVDNFSKNFDFSLHIADNLIMGQAVLEPEVAVTIRYE